MGGHRCVSGEASCRLQFGLTLIEMLVTLAIVSALVGLLSQAMGQLYRIERLLDSGQLAAQNRALRLEQVRIAVEAALPVARNASNAFAGDARGVSFLSSEVPSIAPTGPAAMSLELHFDEANQQTQLRARLQVAGRAASTWIVQSWSGRTGQMSYIDRNGKSHENWPASATDTGTLPAALCIDSGAADAAVLVAQLGVSRQALPTRRELNE